jgi:signal transduction histidine kinase
MPGLPKPYAKRVFEARNGDVYVVNGYRDLAIFSGGKIATVHPAKNMVVGMAEDPHGVVVSVGGELYRAGVDQFRPYEFTSQDKPRFDWILNLAPGRDGSLWVATVNGIFRVKDGEYRHWAAAEGLADTAVVSICEDSDGVVWAGLLSGVARLKDDRIRLIGRKDGLFDDNIYAIVPDDLGNLWLDSGRGIFRASRQTLNDFADGKKPRVECAIFDGLESVKVADKSGQERVGCKTSDGRIWFPGPRGVVMIDPANVLVNRAPPPVHIARVRANRREIDLKHAVVAPGEGRGGLEFHFDALSFLAPQKTKFRHQLVGYEKDWVEATDQRVAFYPDLPPGRYTFRVIAANADGIWNEEGDSLELELRPLFSETIWFRLLCVALALGALAGVYLWRVRYLTRQRRELQKSRDLLETEVRHRTAELATANETLRQDIEERRRMQAEIDKIHRELLEQSREAGMAEVATSVLHNVGNVLNSINVSATLVVDLVRRSKIAQVAKVSELLDQHSSDLGAYLAHDAKGRMIPSYLANLASSLAAEQETIVAELGGLRKNIDHVKDIVAMQQSYAKTSGVVETVSVPELVEDALRMNAGSLARHQIEIARDYAARPVVTVDKNKVLQILVNLIRNAKYACDDSGRTDKLIILRTTAAEGGVDIAVIDNGVGIPAENLTRIFAHGFTTRKHGHGFGLHSGALAAKEMGGSLSVHSDGPGRGAAFTLRLPFTSTERNGSSGRNDT